MLSTRFTLPATDSLLVRRVVTSEDGDPSWRFDETSLLARQRPALWLLDMNRDNPDAASNPLNSTYVAVLLTGSAATIHVELAVHDEEPPLAPERWDQIEQGGGEFGGYAPPSLSSYGWTPQHDRDVAPVLDRIADGWNMIRVSCRDRDPSAASTEVRIDIWPISGPAGKQVIKAASPPPASRQADRAVPDGPGTSDARGDTIGAQTLSVPLPDHSSHPAQPGSGRAPDTDQDPPARSQPPNDRPRSTKRSIADAGRALRSALLNLDVTDNPLITVDLDALDAEQIRQAAPDLELPDPIAEWFALVSAAQPAPRWAELFPAFDVLRIDEALAVRARTLAAWQPQPGSYPTTAGDSAYTFIPEYLPIAERDGTMLVADLRPGARRGLIREFDKVDNDDETATWNDMSDLLGELIEALDNRTTFLGWHPHAQDGQLSWNFQR